MSIRSILVASHFVATVRASLPIPPHCPVASVARLTVLTVPYMADLLEPTAAANGTRDELLGG